MSRILVVDDDRASARTLELHLRAQGFDTAVAHDAEDGLATARRLLPDLIILDIRMPGRSGLDVLPEIKAVRPDSHVIMITAFHDMDTTIEAMQKGAEDYIHKPVDIDELDTVIERLLKSDGDDELFDSAAPNDGSIRMVGRSRSMKEVFKTIGLVARSNTTVLISGESGTGKELVARAIHEAGENAVGPFVVVNCAAVVETLLESDMFGHEKGSFTGALSRQLGKFALAEGGTLFLDEVGEMSPAMQAKLLRVLQCKEFTPLGAKQAARTDARILAATNVDLAEQVTRGAFREDLFYRLQVVNIHLPPLRDRPEDLDDLVRTLLSRINGELRSNISRISREAMNCLRAYQWPGNVRELENVLVKAAALCSGTTLGDDLLPSGMCDEAVASGDQTTPSAPENRPGAQLLSLDELEKAHVEQVLAATDWHRGRACEILGVSRPRLRRMIRQFGLVPPVGVVGDDDSEQ